MTKKRHDGLVGPIRSKYPLFCHACRVRDPVGTMMLWEPGSRFRAGRSFHVACAGADPWYDESSGMDDWDGWSYP